MSSRRPVLHGLVTAAISGWYPKSLRCPLRCGALACHRFQMSNQKFRRLRGHFGHGFQRTLSTWSSRRSSVDLVADARAAEPPASQEGDRRDAEELAAAFPIAL